MGNVVKCGQVFGSKSELSRAIVPEEHRVVVVATEGKIVAFSDPMPTTSKRKLDIIKMRLAGASAKYGRENAFIYPQF